METRVLEEHAAFDAHRPAGGRPRRLLPLGAGDGGAKGWEDAQWVLRGAVSRLHEYPAVLRAVVSAGR